MYNVISVNFYLISRVSIGSLLYLSPSISTAISFFVPIFSFVIHLFFHYGNVVFSNVGSSDDDDAWPLRMVKFIFGVQSDEKDNEAYRFALLYLYIFIFISFYFILCYSILFCYSL
jgi:hypothetical protein